MIRSGLAFAFSGMIALAPLAARAQTEQQALVDRSTLAAQEMLNDQTGHDAQNMLRRARAVMICPQVFQAGFLFGAQGGGCVLVARDGARVVVVAGVLRHGIGQLRLPGRIAG